MKQLLKADTNESNNIQPGGQEEVSISSARLWLKNLQIQYFEDGGAAEGLDDLALGSTSLWSRQPTQMTRRGGHLP